MNQVQEAHSSHSNLNSQEHEDVSFSHEEISHEEVESIEQIDADKEHQDAVQDQGKPKKKAPELAQLHQAISALHSHEEKLYVYVGFMKECLAFRGGAPFRDFWEARKECLPLFKEALNPKKRVELWNEYTQLCEEAKQLKKILDEQSAFAVEQIEIAVQAMEDELKDIADQGAKAGEIELFPACKTLQGKIERYEQLQKELNLLNVLAQRVNQLRKELVKTEMRIKQKNDFFKRLSQMGDSIFPKRKDLIKELSQMFVQDVENFVTTHFSSDVLSGPIFFFRDEIKAFQGIAKILTLNTKAFTVVRQKLSECWDRVRSAEKEWRKEKNKKKEELKQGFEELEAQIQKIKEENSLEEGKNPSKALEAFEALYKDLRTKSFDKEYQKMARQILQDAKRPYLDLIQAKEEEHKKKAADQEKERKQQTKAFEDQILDFIKNAPQMEVADLDVAYKDMTEKSRTAPLQREEKTRVSRLLNQMRDAVTDRKEATLMNLSDNDKQSLSELKEFLKQKKQRREEIKDQLEAYRKAGGGSGLDFEKAMMYNELANEEKDRLAKIDESIRDLRSKIKTLEGKVS